MVRRCVPLGGEYEDTENQDGDSSDSCQRSGKFGSLWGVACCADIAGQNTLFTMSPHSVITLQVAPHRSCSIGNNACDLQPRSKIRRN